MIFVTVGTQDKPFPRLIKAVENAVIRGEIKDEVVVQAGNTEYTSEYINILKYIPFEEFNNYLSKAEVIITHGGVGNILNSLKLNKKVIAIPRLAKYNEHINDHQLQVIKKMTEQGYILSTENENIIAEKIKESKNFTPKEYISNTESFIKGFQSVLDEALNK